MMPSSSTQFLRSSGCSLRPDSLSRSFLLKVSASSFLVSPLLAIDRQSSLICFPSSDGSHGVYAHAKPYPPSHNVQSPSPATSFQKDHSGHKSAKFLSRFKLSTPTQSIANQATLMGIDPITVQEALKEEVGGFKMKVRKLVQSEGQSSLNSIRHFRPNMICSKRSGRVDSGAGRRGSDSRHPLVFWKLVNPTRKKSPKEKSRERRIPPREEWGRADYEKYWGAIPKNYGQKKVSAEQMVRRSVNPEVEIFSENNMPLNPLASSEMDFGQWTSYDNPTFTPRKRHNASSTCSAFEGAKSSATTQSKRDDPSATLAEFDKVIESLKNL